MVSQTTSKTSKFPIVIVFSNQLVQVETSISAVSLVGWVTFFLGPRIESMVCLLFDCMRITDIALFTLDGSSVSQDQHASNGMGLGQH